MGPPGVLALGPESGAAEALANQGFHPLGSVPYNFEIGVSAAGTSSPSMKNRTRSVSLATGVNQMAKEASTSAPQKQGLGGSRPFFTLADISSEWE